MIYFQFNVNDTKIREFFLYQGMLQEMESLRETHRPLWGKMTPLQMIRHLIHSFEISTGSNEVVIKMPETTAEKRKKFLYNNNPTPHEVENPIFEQGQIIYNFESLAEGILSLSRSVKKFRHLKKHEPENIHFHPVFGWLNMMDWERAHYKHCYHHLLQFSLIFPDP